MALEALDLLVLMTEVLVIPPIKRTLIIRITISSQAIHTPKRRCTTVEEIAKINWLLSTRLELHKELLNVQQLQLRTTVCPLMDRKIRGDMNK
jgi:hypothetical protein